MSGVIQHVYNWPTALVICGVLDTIFSAETKRLKFQITFRNYCRINKVLGYNHAGLQIPTKRRKNVLQCKLYSLRFLLSQFIRVDFLVSSGHGFKASVVAETEIFSVPCQDMTHIIF